VTDLMFALVAVFASVALLAGAATSAALSRTAAGRRRLFALQAPTLQPAVAGMLTDAPTARDSRLSTYVPKSPKEMTRLQRRLAEAGFHGFTPVLVYAFSEIALAAVAFLAVVSLLGLRKGAMFAVAAAVQGYLVPGFIVARRIRLRKKQIENGLPDALDLLIVSLEAGLAIDQALLKSAEELEIAYPALSQELHLVNIETRAGKPRLEALKNFAKRSKVDDVRALVAMLVQTDRFGTSVAQALRTHAEVARVKRRQRAEEKAAKLSVKLIFPLVFCLLPAFFVISVGPAIIKFVDFFGNVDLGGLP
jgi:tight adherence protein C